MSFRAISGCSSFALSYSLSIRPKAINSIDTKLKLNNDSVIFRTKLNSSLRKFIASQLFQKQTCIVKRIVVECIS